MYCLERLALRRNFRPRIQKQHHLVMRKKFRVQVIPICGRFIRKMIFGRHLGKPLVRFMHETDVRQILLAGVKSNHPELR